MEVVATLQLTNRPGIAQGHLARTAVKLLPWETSHLSAFAFSAQPGVSLGVGQLIGLTIADVLIVVYLVVVACTGGGRSVHDYVAATGSVQRPAIPPRRHPAVLPSSLGITAE